MCVWERERERKEFLCIFYKVLLCIRLINFENIILCINILIFKQRNYIVNFDFINVALEVTVSSVKSTDITCKRHSGLLAGQLPWLVDLVSLVCSVNWGPSGRVSAQHSVVAGSISSGVDLWRFRNYQRTPNRMLTRRLPDTKCINASPRIRLHASIRLKSEKRKIIKCKVANEKRSRQN